MLKNHKCLKIISVFLAALFFFQETIAAEVVFVPAESVSGEKLREERDLAHDIKIPLSLAQTESCVSGCNDEIVINIQDDHSSLSRQYSIVNVLKELSSNFDIRVVAIEGGKGYIDTSLLKTFPDKKIKEKTADYLMKEGVISAGEFFSVMADEDIALYGAEDDELYHENLAQFREIFSKNTKNRRILKTLIAELKKIEKEIYPEDLWNFVYRSRLHFEGHMSLDIYWDFISDILKRHELSLDEYANIISFTKTVELEGSINFTEATSQRKSLIDRMMEVSSRLGIEELVAKSIDFEKGKIDQGTYHEWLLGAAAGEKINLSDYPELVKFSEYSSAYRDLNVIGLQAELEKAENAVFEKLCPGEKEKERRLFNTVKGMEKIKRLFEIKLSANDVVSLKEFIDGFSEEELAAVLNFSKEGELPGPIKESLLEFEAVISSAGEAVKFYEVAGRRESRMIENTVKAMRNEGKKAAALISGGYHSTGLTGIMKGKGLSYMILMPTTQGSQDRPYVAILTKKTGPYAELAKSGSYELALEAYFDKGDIDSFERMLAFIVGQNVLEGKTPEAIEREKKEWILQLKARRESMPEERARLSEFVDIEALEERLDTVKVLNLNDSGCEIAIAGRIYTVTENTAEVSGKEGSTGELSGGMDIFLPAIRNLNRIPQTVKTVKYFGTGSFMGELALSWAAKRTYRKAGEAFEKTKGKTRKNPTILESALWNMNEAAEMMEMAPEIKEIIDSPAKVTEVNFTVELDDKTKVEIWGFRALHNDARGAGKGGLRWLVAKDETPEDAMKAAVGLATLMSIKNSGVGIPYGGGKGDIFVPDRKYTDNDKAKIVRAFSRALTEKGAVGTFTDVPAPDKGTDARMMAWFLDEHIRTLLEMGGIHDKLLQEKLRERVRNRRPDELVQSDEKNPYLDIYIDILENDDPSGVLRGVELGVITGKPVREGKKVQLGSLGRTKATGFGGFIAFRSVLERFASVDDMDSDVIGKGLNSAVRRVLQKEISDMTVAVQGTGNVGEYNAWEFFRAGAKVTMLEDWYDGMNWTLYGEEGIDLDKLNSALERLPDGRWAPLATLSEKFLKDNGYELRKGTAEFWTRYTDVKVPAATENQITYSNAGDINCAIVLELANSPTTPEADAILAERGLLVIPDVVANAGGVTVSYFEWLQNIEGRYWSAISVDKMLEERMETEIKDVLAVAERFSSEFAGKRNEKNINVFRQSAYMLSLARITDAELSRRQGLADSLEAEGRAPYRFSGELGLVPETVEALNVISSDKESFRELVDFCEKKHDRELEKICSDIDLKFGSGKNGFVMVSGPVTSGKMAVSERIVKNLRQRGREAVRVDVDDLAFAREKAFRNAGYKEADLHKLVIGDIVPVILDLAARNKNEVVVIEGSYVLDDVFMDPVSGILRNENTYGLFVNTAPAMKLSGNIPLTSVDLRLMRHILTFQRLFGSSSIDIIREWPLTRENNLKYVYPSWKNADATFNSYLPYELPVLKSLVSRTLRGAMENAENDLERSTINRIMSALDGVYEMPEGVGFSVDSVIRQFIGAPAYLEEMSPEEVLNMYRGDYVRNHAGRVSTISVILAEEMGIRWSDTRLFNDIVSAAASHDFGSPADPIAPVRWAPLRESLGSKGVIVPEKTSRDTALYDSIRGRFDAASPGEFSKEEMDFALDIFQGPDSLHNLRQRGIIPSRSVATAILFHHHAGELETYLSTVDWPEVEKERTRVILSFLVASDVIENGMNFFKKIFFRDTYTVETPAETMKFLSPSKSGIPRADVIDAYMRIVSERPEKLNDVAKEAFSLSKQERLDLIKYGKISGIAEDGSIIPSGSSTAVIPSLKDIFAPNMSFRHYAINIAPKLEEGLFFFIPAVSGYLIDVFFSTGGAAVLMSMLTSRFVFLLLHGENAVNGALTGDNAPVKVALAGVLLSLPLSIPGISCVYLAAYIFFSTIVMEFYHSRENRIALDEGMTPAVIDGAEDTFLLGDDDADSIIEGIAANGILLSKALKDGITLGEYARQAEGREEASVNNGFKTLVLLGAMEIAAEDGDGKKMYKITSSGMELLKAVWESNLKEWLVKMSSLEPGSSEKYMLFCELRDTYLMSFFESRNYPEARMEILRNNRTAVLDSVFMVLISILDGSETNLRSNLFFATAYILSLLEIADLNGDKDLFLDIMERIMGLPNASDTESQGKMQEFLIKVISRYPDKAKTLVFHLLAGLQEHGNVVRETDNPLFELMDLLHKAGSENFYYFLRRVSGVYFMDNSGQVNVGVDHPLRVRTRTGSYGIDIPGVVRDSIHNNLGVYVLGLLERMFEYYRTGDVEILGDREYKVDAFKKDVVTSIDACFPEKDTLDDRRGKPAYPEVWSLTAQKIFYHLEGDLGTKVGAEGETRYEKLRNISDEGLQKIYDAVNEELGEGFPKMEVNDNGYGFSGYFYAYRELSRRYKRVKTEKELRNNILKLAAVYKSVKSVLKSAGFSDIASEEPEEKNTAKQIGKILEVKTDLKEKIFELQKGDYDRSSVEEVFTEEWGVDYTGNAYGGSWVKDELLGLYMADHAVSLLLTEYIEKMEASLAKGISSENIEMVLEYLKLLGEINNVNGFIPRSFMDKVDTLLYEKGLDHIVAGDVIRLMEDEYIENERYVTHNMKVYIERILDIKKVYGQEERNSEINRRISSFLRSEREYYALFSLLRRLGVYFGGIEEKLGTSRAGITDIPYMAFGMNASETEIERSLGQGRYRLSGKGVELVRMSKEGLPVPDGIVVPATLDMEKTIFSANEGVKNLPYDASFYEGKEIPSLGSETSPLVVSVRSGGYFSMPGQLPTIVNVGLSRDTIEGFTKNLVSRYGLSDEEANWTAWDSYSRFLKSFAEEALKIGEENFKEEEMLVTEKYGVLNSVELPWEGKKELAERYEELIERMRPGEMPSTVQGQFEMSVAAVKGAWQGTEKYRENLRIKGSWPGTAVIVQKMVYGNMKKHSGAGVINSRTVNVKETGISGDFLFCSQGEDIAQHRKAELVNISDIGDEEPWKKDLMRIAKKIDASIGTIAEMEFTVEMGKLYVLQIRNARVGEVIEDYHFTPSQRMLLVSPLDVVPSGGGAYRGMVFNLKAGSLDETKIDQMYKEARERGCDGIIVVSDDLDPKKMDTIITRDINEGGRFKIGGILTKSGGRLSHAATIARNNGITAIVGVKGIEFIPSGKIKINGTEIGNGDIISISGKKGYIMNGLIPINAVEIIDGKHDVNMSPIEYVKLLKTRGQVLMALNDLLREDHDVRDSEFKDRVSGFINLIITNRREILETKAPAVFKIMKEYLEEGRRIEDMRKLLSEELARKTKEDGAMVSDEMLSIAITQLTSKGALSNLGIDPLQVENIELSDRKISLQEGRVSFHIDVVTRAEEPGVLRRMPLRVVLYNRGYGLESQSIVEGIAAAERIIQLYRDGFFNPVNREKFERAGLNMELVNLSHIEAAGDKKISAEILARKIKENNISESGLMDVIGRIDAENMEVFFRRCRAMGSPFSFKRTLFRSLDSEKYMAVKIRPADSDPDVKKFSAADAIVGGRVGKVKLYTGDVLKIRKAVIKTLLNSYDNRIELYKTISRYFNVPEYHSSMTFDQMSGNLRNISVDNIDAEKQKLLYDLLGLTGGFDAGDLEKSFVRAGNVKRFPLDVELKDLILVPGASPGDYIPKILRFGDFFARCSENTIIAHLETNLGFSFDDIFEAIMELYSHEDAIRFMREAYRRESPGSEIFMELAERLEEVLSTPNLLVGIPEDVYEFLSLKGLTADIEKTNGITMVPIKQGDEEFAMESLTHSMGSGVGAAALIDLTVFYDKPGEFLAPGQITSLISDFSAKIKNDILSRDKDLETRYDDLGAVMDIRGMAAVVLRSLPEGMSYNLSEKSLTQIVASQMKIEQMYDSDILRSSAAEYNKYNESGKERYFMAHFADGQDIVDGSGPVIVPPGLEIAKRRREQGLSRARDFVCTEKFFVMAPAGVDKSNFKSFLMKIWMLEGVVKDSDVVILDRKDEGYALSELYGILEGSSMKNNVPTPSNTGFRYLGRGNMLKYDDVARDKGLLQLDISENAVSNVAQYEVLYNMIANVSSGRGGYNIEGLMNVRGGYFVYGLPRATSIDLESEIRRYYELYRREMLIKA